MTESPLAAPHAPSLDIASPRPSRPPRAPRHSSPRPRTASTSERECVPRLPPRPRAPAPLARVLLSARRRARLSAARAIERLDPAGHRTDHPPPPPPTSPPPASPPARVAVAGPRTPTDVMPNKFVEANGFAREVVERGFRFSPRNLGVFAVFGVAVPVLIYQGCVSEFVRARGDPENRTPPIVPIRADYSNDRRERRRGTGLRRARRPRKAPRRSRARRDESRSVPTLRRIRSRPPFSSLARPSKLTPPRTFPPSAPRDAARRGREVRAPREEVHVSARFVRSFVRS